MMTDLLIHELVKSGDITVVERKKIDKIMQEYAFQTIPFVDIKTATKLGKGLGADCIIVGSVATLGYSISMNASKTSFSINIYPYPKKDTLVCLTLNKVE